MDLIGEALERIQTDIPWLSFAGAVMYAINYVRKNIININAFD